MDGGGTGCDEGTGVEVGVGVGLVGGSSTSIGVVLALSFSRFGEKVAGLGTFCKILNS